MKAPPLAAGPAAPARRWLGAIERAGNALPHPATMFALLAASVVVLSGILSSVGASVINPANGQAIRVVNLFSVAGLQRMLTECVHNFITFPPLGLSLMCLLGLGVAEHSGLIRAGLRLMAVSSPRRWMTPMVVFIGILSNCGSELGYVLVVPLGAVLFHALGRNPLAGLAAAFAGVSAGYSANLLIAPVDVLLSGLSQASARIVNPAYVVRPTATYYFMATSVVVLTIAGTWVTEKIVVPRLGTYPPTTARAAVERLTREEKRGLRAALVALGLLVAWVVSGVAIPGGFLQNPNSENLGDSVLMSGLVSFIFLFGLIPGLAYGVVAGTLRNDHDVMNGMTEAMRSLAGYIVMAFFAAQFIAYFNWTNLGVITAMSGARFIQHLGLHEHSFFLVIAFVLFASMMNLLIASASAKWALMAPVFVPMFMLLGFSPELVQAAYGIGDSVTNVITPMLGYFPLVLTFAQRYEPEAGIGKIIAMMLPYTLVFLVIWTVLLLAWVWWGIPVGPGANLFLVR